jgi:hypothetical protein
MTDLTWIIAKLRQRGWQIAMNDHDRNDASDFLVSYDDKEGYVCETPQDLIWLSLVARHELYRHGVDDNSSITQCWTNVPPRDQVAAEYAAFINALWETPEGKRLKVALMWSHCDPASEACTEMVLTNEARRKGKPLPPTPMLDAFGEILLTLRTTSLKRATEHLAWVDKMTGEIGDMIEDGRLPPVKW